MLEKIPRDKELNTLMGRGPYELWVDINSFIDVVDANMVDDIKKMILIKKNLNKKRQNT